MDSYPHRSIFLPLWCMFDHGESVQRNPSDSSTCQFLLQPELGEKNNHDKQKKSNAQQDDFYGTFI